MIIEHLIYGGRKVYTIVDYNRGSMMKDYYTYLYGLPMKLKDPGTIVDPKVTKKRFKGKRYLVLKVSYDQEVGKDTWYFYFDQSTLSAL